MFSKEMDFPSKPITVPGEVLLTLTKAALGKVRKSIPAGPERLVRQELPVSFGLSSVDKVLKKNAVVGITKVHGPLPVRKGDKASAKKLSELRPQMDATYRLRFKNPKINLDKLVKELTKLSEVAVAEPNFLYFPQATPNDPRFADQWGLARINCETGWDLQTGNASVVIAILDSGIDLNHPDLTDNLVAGRDLVDRVGLAAGDVIDIDGQDFMVEGDVLTVDDNPQDDVGHGTHVAGTASAASNNATGVSGVAWSCSLQPVRVMHRIRRLSDNFVTGSGSSADIAAGIRWAADNGANIINLSLGGYGVSSVMSGAVAYAIASGVVVIAAMGNDDTTVPMYPAAYTGVIAVGATDNSDNRAWFSNTGSHISVVAPGVNILSTDWDDAYDDKNGTSMAAPHVAGLAGLLLSCNPLLTVAEVRALIEETAIPLRDNPTDPVPNNQYGHGLIDVRAALEACTPKGKEWIKEIKEGIKEFKELPKEFKEFKEAPKEFKELPKEGKEFKEGPKEFKEGPKEFKEAPKEFKELPKEGVKEFKEGGKEFKEDPKELVEGPGFDRKRFENKPSETPFDPRINPDFGGMKDIADRLRGIEKMLGRGQAFITQSERPDVGDKISKS